MNMLLVIYSIVEKMTYLFIPPDMILSPDSKISLIKSSK